MSFSTTWAPTGSILGHLSISHDIGDRKRLERQALQITAKCQRIGQELHDDACQELLGVSLMVGSLSEMLTNLGLRQATLAENIKMRLQRAIENIQTICNGLIPVDIDKDGLIIAFDNLANRVEHMGGPQCAFQYHEPIIIDDKVTANGLYGIAREAVNNAVRHGHARHVRIDLGTEHDSLVLRIEDDGIGIPSPIREHAGLGLRIMHHRADIIGARLSVAALPGGGSEVSCVLRNRSAM